MSILAVWCAHTCTTGDGLTAIGVGIALGPLFLAMGIGNR